MPSNPVLCPQANYARLDVAMLLRGFPRTAASTATAPTATTTTSAVTPGAASISAAATLGARSAAEGTQVQPQPQSQQPRQPQQGHVASPSSPVAGCADAAGPSTSAPGIAGAASSATAGGAAAATRLGVIAQRLPVKLLPLAAFPGTAPGQVLRRRCAERLVEAQGEQAGPLPLGVLLAGFAMHPVGQCFGCPWGCWG